LYVTEDPYRFMFQSMWRGKFKSESCPTHNVKVSIGCRSIALEERVVKCIRRPAALPPGKELPIYID